MSFYPIQFPTRRDHPETVLVYIEKKIDNSILIDFFDSNEFTTFANTLGLPNDWEENGSIIEFLNYTGRKIQRGVIYHLNLSALQALPVTSFEVQNESLILAYTIDLSALTEELFGNSVSMNKLAIERMGVEYNITGPIDDLRTNISIDKVIVRKIGQGNWNELYCGNQVKIVFDAGTIYTTSRAELIAMIGGRNILYQEFKPILILSHWDVDHYHFLLAMEDATIQAFQKFIFRNKVPSLTGRKIMGRFAVLNPRAPFPINAEPRPRYTRGVVRLISYPFNTSGTLQLFNAQNNRSRNKSGIGLLLRNTNDSVVFSGDFNYDQLNANMVPLVNYSHDKHYLIVPHHGGQAGRIIYGLSGSIGTKTAIISVGRNPYNPRHPYGSTINELVKLRFNVVRTDLRPTDYEITL